MYETAKKTQLLEINSEIQKVIDAVAAVSPVSPEKVSGWENMCKMTENRLEDDLLRMAVVGTIKSGKSTFINSLFSGDYLKRGPGVITSIVTKVRASKNLKAKLYFKSWGEINKEIEQSLRIFFSAGMRTRSEPFDIRDAEDRRWLRSALENLESKHLVTNDTRNMDHVLLGAYLTGYPDVDEIVSEENRTVVYENEKFALHRDFVGSEHLSAYLNDIKLEIDTDSLEPNIEIADCQGSDSPNPLHLAMIQDYLQSADLVVYIISSRTGLRQADIRFLSMIKNISGMNHVLFVVNSDFNEHASIADLQRVAGKVREELEMVVSEPSVYVFSSLFLLFSSSKATLAERDLMRVNQWEMDEALISFSNNEEKRFQQDFRQMITEQRYAILLKSQLHFLNFLASDIENWLNINREVLTTDQADTAGVLDKIEKQQQQTDQLRSMIKTTLDGSVMQLKKETRSQVDKFFDIRYGESVPGIIEYVQGYNFGYEQTRQLLEKGDFSDALFAVFQAFKRDLDRYVAENVNPVLISFIKKKEDEIARYFENLSGPYSKMIMEYREGNFLPEKESLHVDLDTIKKKQSLSVPSAAATLDYTGALKTEAFMKLGWYRFAGAVKKMFKKDITPANRDLPALKAGIRRMKKETETSLIFHFKNYRENIKFQYFFKLIEGLSDEMLFQLTNRFSNYHTDLLHLKRMAGEGQEGKAETIQSIGKIQARVSDVKEALGEIDKTL